MPVVVTFDIQGAEALERNRLQSCFERLGRENLGGGSYRYPCPGSDQPVEDRFNHVLTALMLLRTYIVRFGRQMTKLTLDTETSSGFNPATTYGTAPCDSAHIAFYAPNNHAFGERIHGKDFDCLPLCTCRGHWIETNAGCRNRIKSRRLAHSLDLGG